MISVIIPCFNASRYLKSAVESIINQSYSNLEIICINDGSTDETLDILETIQKTDSRIRIINNPQNLGLIKTLNKGISIAKGEYIARMDADDISHPERLERQLTYLNANNLDLIGSYCKIITANGHLFCYGPHFPCSEKAILWTSLFESPLAHPTVFGKKEIFDKYHYSEEEFSYVVEDYELWCRMLENGVKVGIIPEFLLSYRRNKGGETFSKAAQQNFNHKKVSYSHMRRLLNYEPNKTFDLRKAIYENNSSINIKEYFEGLENIRNIFYQIFSPNEKETSEIDRWIRQKKILLLQSRMLRGDFSLNIIKLFLHLFFQQTPRIVADNLYSRGLWIKGKLIEYYEAHT